MSLATELQDDIAELLDDADIGRTITISRPVPGTYAPADGSSAASTEATFTLRALFLGYEDRLIDGTLIKRGDRRCFLKVKNSTYVPVVGDEVVAGSDICAVVDFKTIELSGTAIIYILQVRR